MMKALIPMAVFGLALTLLTSCAALPKEMLADNQQLRQKALRFNVARYASNDMVAAETNFTAGSNFYSNNNGKSSKALGLSKESYEAALAKGLPLYITEKETASTNEKGAADGLKAVVASKTKYEEAMALYKKSLEARPAADALLPRVGSNSNADPNYFQATPAKLTGKAKEKYDADRKDRREKLIEAAEYMEKALVKFEEAKKESADKKSVSDKALSEALGDLSETEKTAKSLQPKPPAPKKKAPAKK